MILIFLITPSNVYALSCAEKPSIMQSYKNADFVFIGEYKKLLQDGNYQYGVFNVEKVWKGTEEQIESKIFYNNYWGIETGADNEKFLIYANEGQIFSQTAICDRSSRIEESLTDLETEFSALSTLNAPSTGDSAYPNIQLNFYTIGIFFYQYFAYIVALGVCIILIVKKGARNLNLKSLSLIILKGVVVLVLLRGLTYLIALN